MNQDKKLWFKRKAYGWGWAPASWQGWVALAIYIVIMISFSYINQTQFPDGNLFVGFVFPFIIFTSILIFICYKKGESPKWQWGTERIVLDVAVLLPEKIHSICVEANSLMHNQGFVSFKDGYNPHMSLVQVCIDKSDLEDFKKEISTLLSNTKVLDLEITGFGPTKSGKFKQFNVGNTEDFTNLHKNVLNIAKKYKKLPVKKSYFYESDQISDSLLSYVTHFEEKYANENFDPHITLGIGEYNDKNVYPIKFQTDKIKIFHLGRNGTCKKEIV